MEEPPRANPFKSLHLPVRDPARLYGRAELVEGLADAMTGRAPPQCVGLYGPRRIGKTSVVRCAERVATNRAGSLTPIIIYEDAATWQGRDQSQILRKLTGRICDLIGERPSSSDPADAIQAALEATTASEVRVTFIFDEVGKAARNPRLDEGFFSFLRSLTSFFDVQYITCSPEPMMDYFIGLPTADSTFFGLFVTKWLGGLSDESGEAMLLSSQTSIPNPKLLTQGLGGLPLLLAHAGNLLWEEPEKASLAPQQIVSQVVAMPETRAFLGQLREWAETTGEKYSHSLPGAPDLWHDAARQIPARMKSYWPRLEASAKTEIFQAEDMYRRYKNGPGALTAEAVCFSYGKALELQVKHSIVEGLSEFLPETVDTLGQYGKQIKLLSKAGASPEVAEYLRQRGVSRRRFQDFGEHIFKVSELYRNPAAHETSMLSSRDVEDARRRVSGEGDQPGLLLEAVAVHWGDRAVDGQSLNV